MGMSKRSIHKFFSLGITILATLLTQTTVISADSTKWPAQLQTTSTYTKQGSTFPERVYNDAHETMAPILLENGLTIQLDKVQNEMKTNDSDSQRAEKVPAITWNGRSIWKFANDLVKKYDSDRISFSFTQTKTGDTIFACSVQSLTECNDSKMVLLGIHSTGEVFLHNIWSGAAYTIRFIGADSWEIAKYLDDVPNNRASDSSHLIWNVEKYRLSSTFDMQKVDTYRQAQKEDKLQLGRQPKDSRVDWYNPWGDREVGQAIAYPMETGKPINNVEEARRLLLYIIAAEGLQTTSITFSNTDQYGNYYFDVWYRNFPHTSREVTKDGYVIEDEDNDNTLILPENQL